MRNFPISTELLVVVLLQSRPDRVRGAKDYFTNPYLGSRSKVNKSFEEVMFSCQKTAYDEYESSYSKVITGSDGIRQSRVNLVNWKKMGEGQQLRSRNQCQLKPS